MKVDTLIDSSFKAAAVEGHAQRQRGPETVADATAGTPPAIEQAHVVHISPAATNRQLQGQPEAEAGQQQVLVDLLDAHQQPGKHQHQQQQEQRLDVSVILAGSYLPHADSATAAVAQSCDANTSGVKRNATAAGLTQTPAQQPHKSSSPGAAADEAVKKISCGGAGAAATPAADAQHTAAGSVRAGTADGSRSAACATGKEAVTVAAAKRQRLEPTSTPWQPAATQQQQHVTANHLAVSAATAAAAAAETRMLPGQLPSCFPFLAPSTAAHNGNMPMGQPGVAATAQQAPGPGAVLPHHIPGIPVSWPPAQPVLGLPGTTIQAAAAAAAAAAATATRAAMGQDPTLGWTPAMAAAAMVAAAGAHEGAAVTAAGAAPRVRHGHHATRGRRHQAAAKDEDISSRQGSLRVLGSASVGGATKGVSAELSDAAQPAPTASAVEEAAAAAGVPLRCLGLLAAPDPPQQQQQQHLMQFRLLPNEAKCEQQQNIVNAHAAAAAGGSNKIQTIRAPVRAVAGISNGPAAAEVQGFADEVPQAVHSGLLTDHTEGSQPLPPAAADAVGSPPSPSAAQAAGSESAMEVDKAEQQPGPCGHSPAAAAAGGVAASGESPDSATPVVAYPATATTAGAGTCSNGVGGGHDNFSKEQLARRFQEQQLRQQLLCLAALDPAVAEMPSGAGGSPAAAVATAATGATTVQGPSSTEQQHQQQHGSGHTSGSAGGTPGSANVAPISSQQQFDVCGVPAPHMPAHWAPMGYQEALATAANTGLVVASMPAGTAAAGPGNSALPSVSLSVNAEGPSLAGLALQHQAMAAAAQRSGSDPLSSGPGHHQQHQGPQPTHNGIMTAAAAGAAAAGVPPVSSQAALPGLTAATAAGMPGVTLPPPALVHLNASQQPSLPHHMAVQHDTNWMQPNQAWRSPWTNGNGNGHAAAAAAHHLALNPSGGGATAAANLRGLPITPTAAGGHLPGLLPVAPLHTVPPVGPGQLLPVAPVLGHNAGARAPEPVTPAEASMTSAAARLQQLQQHEAATHTPSGVTTTDVAATGEAETEQTLREVSRQLQQHVEQQQQQQQIAAEAAAAVARYEVSMQDAEQLAAPVVAAADAVDAATLREAAADFGAAGHIRAQHLAGLDMSVPVAVGWVGVQQPALGVVIPGQHPASLELVLAGDKSPQKAAADKQQQQKQQQHLEPAVDAVGQLTQQLGNSGRSTSTAEQSSGGANQASQPGQQQQQGSGSNGNGNSGNGSNGNGSGSGQTAAADPHAPEQQQLAPLPPPPPRQPGTATARAAHPTNPSTQQAAVAAAAAIADANNAAVAIAAAAVAVAANAAAHAVAATGGSGTAQSTGTHLLGYVGGSAGGSAGNGSGGNGSGGTGGSGSNGLHDSNMVASNALLGSNGIGSGAMGSGSGAMGSGTAGGGGSGGEGSGPNDGQSEPAQLPASTAAAAAAVAAQQQLLQAMFPAGLPGSAAVTDPAAAAALPALVVPPCGTAGVLAAPESTMPASAVSPAAAGAGSAPQQSRNLAASGAQPPASGQQLQLTDLGGHGRPAAAMHQPRHLFGRQPQQQQQHGASTPVRTGVGLAPLQSAAPQQQNVYAGHQQLQQPHLPASLAPAAAAAPGAHTSSPTAAQHLVQQQQQQQQAAWWQQQQLLLAQQAYHWQTGLSHQAALLQHLPAAVAVMGLQGLAQWPSNALISSQWSQQQQHQQQLQQQHQLQQQAVAAAAAVTQQHFVHLQQAAAQHPEQVIAAAAGQPAAMCAAAAAAAAAAAGVPVMDSGGLQGENVLLPGLVGLNGSGGNGAGATDAAGGAADGSAGGATAGNGSGGTGGATGGTGGGSGNGSGGTAGGTGHGSGGTHGTGGTGGTHGTGGTNATYGTNGLNGSGGASWGLRGSNTVGVMGLTSGGNGSSWAAHYSGAAAGAAGGAVGHAAGHHFGVLGGQHQHHIYSSHCAENTPAAAGMPPSVSQQQRQHSEHHKPQSAAAQHQQQQFLQQCHSLMQQKLHLLQHPAAAGVLAPGNPALHVPLSPLLGLSSQQQMQLQQQQQQQQQAIAAAAAAALRQPLGSAVGTPSAVAAANPALSSQAMSLQNLLWLQQNAVSAVQHYQTLQQAQQMQQQQQQQQNRTVAGPIENTVALNSWVPSTLPVQGTPAAAAAMQSGTAAVAAATADGGSGGADGSGGGTGGTGGGTGNGSNDPEATAGPATGNYTSLVASSAWMSSNLQQQQQQVPPHSAGQAPVMLQQQQPPASIHQGQQPYLHTQVPLQQLLPPLPVGLPPLAATTQLAALLPDSTPNQQPPAGDPSLPGIRTAAAAAGGGSSGGGSLMGIGSLLPPLSSGFAAGAVPPAVQGFAGAGGSNRLAGPPSHGLPPNSAGLSFWPSSLTNAAVGLTTHELLPASTMLQQIMPNAGWAELGAQTAACFNAGLSPSLYWQYLTAAALLAQPPNSAAMVNAARAYHYFQQYLNPNMVSDWLEDRTPSLASSAASEESAKESPNIERADRVSEAVDLQMEEEDLPTAAAAADVTAAERAAAAAATNGVGCKGVAAGGGGRAGRKRGHAAETDSEQDEASSRRKYR